MNASRSQTQGLGGGRYLSRRKMVIGGKFACLLVVALEASHDLWRGQHLAAVAGIALALANALLCIALIRRYPALFFESVVAIAACAWVGTGVLVHGVDGVVLAYASIGALMLIAPTRFSKFFALCVLFSAIAALHRLQGSAIDTAIVLKLVAFTAFVELYTFSMGSQRQAVEAQRLRLDLLLQCSDAGSLEWTGGEAPAYYSPRLRCMLGLAPDTDTARLDFWSHLPPGFRERVKDVFTRDIALVTRPYETMPPVWMEYPLIRSDRSRIWVHARAIRVSGSDGRLAHYVCTFVDITERIDIERRLRLSNARVEGQMRKLTRQRAALERALRAREEVEHLARHDLKTPLGQIVSITDTLRCPHVPVLMKDALMVTLEATARRAMRVLKLAIDFYPIEEGRFAFVPEPVDLTHLVRKVCDTFRAHARSKQIGFVLDFAPDPLWAQADAVLCETIVENLLKNAIEAAPEGSSITIVLRNGHRVVFSIHNEGMVPSEVQGNFFQKYATAGKVGGTGLGAYSARLMARAQRGELRMSTSADEGTRLVLELQTADDVRETAGSRGKRPHDPASAVPPRWDILVVDDDVYSSLAVAAIADAHGTVRTAVNGRAALEAVMAHRADIILMDLEMPVMGGFEAVGLIRSFQSMAGQRPSLVIALSAHEDAHTVRRCHTAGFDRCECKPITRDSMARLFDACDVTLEDAR